ncbi:MAG: purine-nucleoside phosphorylase, partial [Anaerolineae bacterium]|nr:purine-nucleoside phosphorylase [Anaerolineae bacterium]
MAHDAFTRAHYREAAEAIRARTSHRPTVGLILGSGLNALADEVAEADRIPYAEIPHFPRPGEEGHVGRLVIGQLEGQDVAILQGRVHAYEGYSLQAVTFPVRVLAELGVKT